MKDNKDLTQEEISPLCYADIYLNKMGDMLDDNLDSLRDPQALSHAFNLAFEIIYDSFKEKIKEISNISFNVLLYEALQDDNPLLACDFEFIKYIHIYNFSKKIQDGAVDIGIDFVNQTIIDDCTPVEKGNSIFKKDTLAILYNETNGFFGNNIIEYCNNPHKLVLDPRSYSAVTRKYNKRNRTRTYYFCDLFKYLLATDSNINTCEEWFDRFEKNNTKCVNNTNFFFIQSNCGGGSRFDDIWKYVLYANIGIDSTKADKDCIKVFLQKFTQFLDKISIDILMKITQDQTSRQIFHQDEINAIAYVMARTMRHNIGSHVYSNLTGNNVYEMLTDENISKINTYVSMYENNNNLTNTHQLKDNRDNLQVPYFNRYVCSRMDYIGEVVLNSPNMLTTRYIYNDVFKDFDRVKILLNYISGIPDFRYTFCLKYNGNIMTEENDIAVAFPSDALGVQAFCNIIENIIRNTAKHACRIEQGINTFTIEFKDVASSPEYYCVEIDNGVKEENIDGLVIDQNKYIKESTVNKNDKFRVRDHALGVLEMKIAAAFLRQVNMNNLALDEYIEKNDRLLLLEAINKKGSLCYRFYINKSKEILLVGDWNIDKSKNKEMFNLGIEFITEHKFVKDLGKGKSFAHRFLIYQDKSSSNVKDLLSDDNDCKTLLPIRKLMLGKEEIDRIINTINSAAYFNIKKSIIDFVWDKYYEKAVVMELKNTSNKEIKIRTAYDPDKGKNQFVFNQVVFLNHSFKDTHNTIWQKVSNASDFEVWIENLSSLTMSKLPCFREYAFGGPNPISDYVENIKKETTIKYEIFEAYHNKVIALDERIQKYSLNTFEGSSGKEGGPIPCSELFKSTNVLIPEIPLDPVVFTDEIKKQFEVFVDENIKGAFLLVHYGILDRLYKLIPDITNKLNEWSKKAKRVIVTSGRGAYSLKLPPSVCYADLSSVRYAFIENRNKYTINDLLNQSRRKHD